MTDSLFLGVDIGTSSSKGVLVDTKGRIVARERRAHKVSNPQPGWWEHDASGDWWQGFVQITRQLLRDRSAEILAVGVSGIGPCFLPADNKGIPLRPAILYGVDTRATAEIDELTRLFGEDAILARSGSVLSSQAVGPKLQWLRKHEPEVFRNTKRLFMASSYLVYKLTGEYVLDHHSASQCDPLYDMGKSAWATDWIRELAPELELPLLRWPVEIAGEVSQDASVETGIPAGTPVATGTIDAWAEAASVGVARPGDIMVMYGTTLFVIQIASALHPNKDWWTTAGILPGSITQAAGMSTSGALTDWFKKLVGATDFRTLIVEATATPPGAHGLVTLPYFEGERSPIIDPLARGAIVGLTLSHSRGHLYRSLLESVGFGVRHIFEAMHVDPTVTRLVAVGGGSQASLGPQIVTDIVGMSQDMPAETIGASYGDAWLAAVAVGHTPSDHCWNRVIDILQPRPEFSATYERLYSVYRSLYVQTADLVHQLARIQADSSEFRNHAAVT